MPTLNFTDVTVQRLPEGLYFDTKTPAFGIRIGKRTRTWLVLKQPNRTKVTLGHYPACSLQEARRLAYAELGKEETKKTITFTEARDRFFDAHLPTLRPRSAYQLERTLRKYFHWQKRLGEITHDDVASVIEKIKAKSEAAHALKDIKTFFSWCVPRLITHSPAVGIKRTPYKPRERLLSDAEIAALWKHCEPMDWFSARIKMLILTGQRIGQFIAFDPAWVKDGAIVWPAHIMKGATEHRIPLPEMAREIIPHLKQHTYQHKKWVDLLKRSGVQNATPHDFRKYFSSCHARLHTDITVTEAMLAHVSGSRSPIQRIYDLYDRYQEMIDATARYEAHLQKILQR